MLMEINQWPYTIVDVWQIIMRRLQVIYCLQHLYGLSHRPAIEKSYDD